MSSVNLHLSCHCRNFTWTLSLPTTSLPLKSAICHCSLCRHSTGLSFATFAVIPFPSKPSCTGLTGFDSSENLTRWFCSTCGCSIWNDDRVNDEWEVATGVITGVTYDAKGLGTDVGQGPGSPEGPSEGLQLIDGLLNRVQLWVGATGDGGIAIWLNDGKLAGMPRYLENRDSETVEDATLSDMAKIARSKLAHTHADSSHDGNQNNKDQKMKMVCACGAIDLHISRPTTETKYKAGVDACYSCRKSTGFEITTWATVPHAQITWADTDTNTGGKPVTLQEPQFATYNTTEEVTRYFCRVCGVPAICNISGRDTWDLATGMLEAEGEGARVEGWLVWTKYGDTVQYVEDAIDKGLVDNLGDGLKRDRQANPGW